MACSACHQPEVNGLGPSLKAIQARLGKDEALIKAATANVLNGTIGKPSQYGLPATSMMPPNSAMLSAEEADFIVRHLIATGKLTP
jgi:cytochrome c551/c552